jgi:hypothetical protein
MIGFIVEHESDVTELHATDYLPADVVAPRSVGQIYGAALLENGRLALSIGWTNAKSRNINGIAILKRELGAWRRDRVIVMPGSVRDLASGPDNTILAVATDVDRNRENGIVEVVLVDPASGIRSRLYDRWLSIEQAEQEALQIRLQRMPGRSFAVFDIAAGTMRLFSTAGNRDSATVRRLLSLADVPAEARALSHLTIDAVRLHADGSLTVARHGYDGVTTQLVVTRYGKVSDTWRVPQVAAQSAVISDDFVEVVIMDRVAPKRVSIPLQ